MSQGLTIIWFESGFDELGEPVECSRDLFPLVEFNEEENLDEHGLVQPGTKVQPGMVLFGMIGKSTEYEPAKEPNEIQILTLAQEELRKQFGHLWVDYSQRVPDGVAGTVVEVALERRDDSTFGAKVVIDQKQR